MLSALCTSGFFSLTSSPRNLTCNKTLLRICKARNSGYSLPLIRFFDRMAATDVKKMPVKSVSEEDMIKFTRQSDRRNSKVWFDSYNSLLTWRFILEIFCQIHTQFQPCQARNLKNWGCQAVEWPQNDSKGYSAALEWNYYPLYHCMWDWWSRVEFLRQSKPLKNIRVKEFHKFAGSYGLWCILRVAYTVDPVLSLIAVCQMLNPSQ